MIFPKKLHEYRKALLAVMPFGSRLRIRLYVGEEDAFDVVPPEGKEFANIGGVSMTENCRVGSPDHIAQWCIRNANHFEVASK